MKKFEMVEALVEQGFTAQPVEAEVLRRCDGIILQRTWSKEI